uniref:Uncharacterized protein n=1 Tax=Saccharum hybrid cultivar R570 TaxID=131158 RepID=A0A059Q375_9POAL|nr:hypothetical protein SHCRBa_146_G08_F_160 [Saccharum hybrid cultivar R570]
MSCLKLQVPAMRVWRRLSARLGLRRPCRAGQGRLRKEVRTCEYGDVHVMWAMLSSNPSSGGKGAAGQDAHDVGEEARPRCCRLKPAGVLLLRSPMSSVCCGPSRAEHSPERRRSCSASSSAPWIQFQTEAATVVAGPVRVVHTGGGGCC